MAWTFTTLKTAIQDLWVVDLNCMEQKPLGLILKAK